LNLDNILDSQFNIAEPLLEDQIILEGQIQHFFQSPLPGAAECEGRTVSLGSFSPNLAFFTATNRQVILLRSTLINAFSIFRLRNSV